MGEEKSKLFLANIGFAVTEVELMKFIGEVLGPGDRRPVAGRQGWWIVDFGSPEAAREAIGKLNNRVFMGRPIAAKECLPRGERPKPRELDRREGESVRRERPRRDAVKEGYGWTREKPEDKDDGSFVKDLQDRMRKFEEGGE